MDATRFDRLTRLVTDASSRRDLLRGLAGATLGTAAIRLPGSADAKKKQEKHKKKRKKPMLNAFGCLNVGQACGGNSDRCCSGICQGKRPKKGKKDRSTCAAHNVGVCTATQDACAGGSLSCGANATCYRTTGNASFCGTAFGASCTACAKDTDCEGEFGPGAACLRCANCPDPGTLCTAAQA